MINRRNFLGALVALAAAPFAVKKAVGGDILVYETSLQRIPITPVETITVAELPSWMRDGYPATAEIDKEIRRMVIRMQEETNKWMYCNGDVYESLPKKLQQKYDAGEREFFNSPLWRSWEKH